MNMFNELKETATKRPAALAPLAGLLNPATIIPVVTIGIIGAVAYSTISKLKSENKELSTDKRNLRLALEDTIIEAGLLDDEDEHEDEEDFEPLDLIVEPTVHEPLNEPFGTVQTNGSGTVQAIENTIEDAIEEPIDEKEILRRAMSELGKRSGEARRLKKLEKSNLDTN